jgi:Na+-driven multidrug efflux pump
VDQVAIRSAVGSAVIVAVGALLATLFAEPLMGLFVNKSETNWQEVIDTGFPKLMFTSWGYIIFSFAQVFGGVLKGLRKATLALVCNLGGVIVPRLIWVWFVIPKMHTPIMLYAIYPISWVISTGILLYALLHCRKKLLVEETA